MPISAAVKAEKDAAAKAAGAKKKEEERAAEFAALLPKAQEFVRVRREDGDPVNRSALCIELVETYAMRRQSALKLIATWVKDDKLAEVTVPKALRKHPNQAKFLIELTNEEGIHYLFSGELPPGKTTIPDSWRRS